MTVQPEFSRQARRWARLMAGLVAFGVGIALMKHADLGLGPWEVLNDGLSRITGVSLGTVGIVVGVPILLLWLPLRERPGIGTILNIIVIGVVINEMLRLLPPLAVIQALAPGAPFLPQGLEMALGIGVIGFASALYLGANLGAGPRDGLMMGLTRRTGLEPAHHPDLDRGRRAGDWLAARRQRRGGNACLCVVHRSGRAGDVRPHPHARPAQTPNPRCVATSKPSCARR